MVETSMGMEDMLHLQLVHMVLIYLINKIVLLLYGLTNYYHALIKPNLCHNPRRYIFLLQHLEAKQNEIPCGYNVSIACFIGIMIRICDPSTAPTTNEVPCNPSKSCAIFFITIYV